MMRGRSSSHSARRGPGAFRDRVAALGLTGADILALHGVEAFRGGRDHVKICCPVHDDGDPSCSIHVEHGYAHCFGCCEFRAGDIVALHRALGRFESMGAALRDLERVAGTAIPPLKIRSAPGGHSAGCARPHGEPVTVAEWKYQLADGAAAFLIRRRQRRLPDGSFWRRPGAVKPHKEYIPAHPRGFPNRLPEPYASGALRPIYRLPEVLAADPSRAVYVTEGEPAADALRGLGWIATTSSGGCGVAEKSDWSPLAGRRVVVWPDNDEAGQHYAVAVTRLLRSVDPNIAVTWVDVPRLELPPGGDAVEWLARRERNEVDFAR